MTTIKKPLTAKGALLQAKEIFGAKAHVNWDPSALDEEGKELLRKDMAEARSALKAVGTTDKTALAERKRRVSEISSKLLAYRASVGFVAGVGGIQFFHVKGQGDTWEQALERAKRDA